MQRDDNKKNRGTNLRTGRSIIFDDKTQRQYELIPRASLDELFEISKALPTVEIAAIAKNTKNSTEPPETRTDERYYKIVIGAGAHSQLRIARVINSDNSYGEYITVKKAQSSGELFKTHSRNNSLQKSALINSTKTLSKSTTLPIIPHTISEEGKGDQPHRSSSTPNSMKLFGDSKRRQIIDSIQRELQVNTLLADLPNVCLSEAQVHSTKKRSDDIQLYQFMPYATLGDLKHFQDHIKNTLFSFEAANKLRTNITNQMIHAILLLHTKSDVRHRDIKLDNFLLTAEGKVLLTDFGAAAYRDSAENNNLDWKLVSLPTFVEYTPPTFLSKKSSDANFRIHDEWALAKSILELWQIDTSELNRIRILNKSNTIPDNEIQQMYTKYQVKLLKEMDIRKIPAHIQNFISDALEINLDKRKENIRDMVDENQLKGPDITEELTKIKGGITAKNQMFFADASKHNDKYTIQGILLGKNEVIGYDDDSDPVDNPNTTAPKP